MRKRISIRSSMVGSSDVRRIHSRNAILKDNHEKNVDFFLAIKEKSKEVVVEITEEYLLQKYSEVMVLGSWSPLSKYRGMIVTMYNNFKMR